MKKVLVVGKVCEEAIDLLRARADIEIAQAPDGPSESFADKVPGISAILLRTSMFGRELIASAPDLEVVSRHGVGYDNVDVEALNERGIPLAVSATANNISVAEHALFMMLELAKAGRPHDAAIRANNWSIRLQTRAIELSGSTLLLVGFGRIGKAVAPRALALGMTVLVRDPYVNDAIIRAAGCVPAEDLESGLRQADIVSLHLPLDAGTRNMIDEAALVSMKPGAMLINTARGGLVDEHALARALRAGTIRSAALDVLLEEPPPADHPLLDIDNVLLSPHSAGVTQQSMLRMGTEAAQNILDILDGRRDPGVIVNYERIG